MLFNSDIKRYSRRERVMKFMMAFMMSIIKVSW